MLRLAILVVLCIAASAAVAQPDPSGIEFVSVGAPGNAPWPGNGTPNDRAVGRGSVGYNYEIGKYEITTSQWVDFFNAAFDRPQNDLLPNLIPPGVWGAVPTTPHTPGGQRWTVPAGNDMLPVGNISWHMAAMYCNWLCNNKGTQRADFMNGAYDATTFGYTGSVFTDQLVHNPGARYWIPTWDEWLKAAHFDPNHSGPGQGGWWLYPNRSDTPLAYGPPGVHVRAGGIGVTPGPDPNGPLAQANANWDGINFPGYNPYAVPLGAYGTAQSPWGLFDVSGGTMEWTEETLFVNGIFPAYRVFDGGGWDTPQAALTDLVNHYGGDFPSLSTSELGFRIATIPAAPTCVPVGILFCLSSRRRRPRGEHEQGLSRCGQG